MVLRLEKRVLKSWTVDEVCEFDERRLRDLLVLISICEGLVATRVASFKSW